MVSIGDKPDLKRMAANLDDILKRRSDITDKMFKSIGHLPPKQIIHILQSWMSIEDAGGVATFLAKDDKHD